LAAFNRYESDQNKTMSNLGAEASVGVWWGLRKTIDAAIAKEEHWKKPITFLSEKLVVKPIPALFVLNAQTDTVEVAPNIQGAFNQMRFEAAYLTFGNSPTHPFVDRAYMGKHEGTNHYVLVLVQDKARSKTEWNEAVRLLRPELDLFSASWNRTNPQEKEPMRVSVMCIAHIVDAEKEVEAEIEDGFLMVTIGKKGLVKFYTPTFAHALQLYLQDRKGNN
jgi:hypothetical protein